MNIYFAGSIRGGRDDVKLYAEIIAYLSRFGTVLTEHVGDHALFEKEVNRPNEDIYKQDMGWLDAADIIVAEVTQPSLGVGYEIRQAEAMDKPIICLWRAGNGRSLSAMIAGNGYEKLSIIFYTSVEGLSELLHKEFVKRGVLQVG